MENKNFIKVIAIIKIDPAQRQNFENMMGDLKKVVAGEGKDKVLTYDCYFKDQDSGEGLIIETYSDETAFLNHLELIKPVSAQYNISMDVLNLSIAGRLPNAVLQLFSTIYKDKFVNYGCHLG